MSRSSQRSKARLTRRDLGIPAALGDAPWSAVESIYVVINGETGADMTARQGLTSALADGLSPRNITDDVAGSWQGIQPALGFSSGRLGRWS